MPTRLYQNDSPLKLLCRSQNSPCLPLPWRSLCETWLCSLAVVCWALSPWRRTRCLTLACSLSWGPGPGSVDTGRSLPGRLCGIKHGLFTHNLWISFKLILPDVWYSPVFGVNDGVDKRVVDGRCLGYNGRDGFRTGSEDASVAERCVEGLYSEKQYVTYEWTVIFHHAVW